MSKIKVEIVGLSSSPSSGGAYALLMKETYGNRRLPIIIGAFEAQAIALELENITAPRPMTHDLLKIVLETLGASVTEIEITDLRDNTYYAEIRIDVSSIAYNIDSRPSDAIALAVRTASPIYVSEDVMSKASFIPDDVDSMTETMEKIKETVEESNAFTEVDIATLQDQLRIALEQEDYEKAARLRDEINKRTKNKL